jgi:hypothetical protein
MTAAARHAIPVVFCLLGTPALAAEPTTPFNCNGPFGRDASHAKLAATFGAGNIVIRNDEEADAEVTIPISERSEASAKGRMEGPEASAGPELRDNRGALIVDRSGARNRNAAR